MSALFTILALLALGELLTLLAASRAPRGYEDEHGFHLLRRRK